ncbi:MAG TPA: hypothetical protein VFM98_01785 [Ramlibacter sp.]|uniref:hypothetical protein n=1 Tax=Ramlibacter sp. TaxID=1917967 RepID=UPI002D7FDB84|nr:hypothetical protein [Ramlibacter sp.]HET8744306.1 hypothetical protein [Ramlibacter sp.]
MATGVAEKDDEVLDSEQETDLQEDRPQEGDGHEEEGEAEEGAEDGGDDGPGSGEEEGEEETVVSIGTEEPPTSETKDEGESTVFADLRKRYRETKRELEQLKAQQQGGAQAHQQQAPKLRDKPTLEAHDFDAQAFQADLDKWYAEKGEADRKAAELAAARAAQEEAQRQAAQAVQESYAGSKKALKVKDYQEAEDEVAAQFSQVQQSIVIGGAANPALLVYALGKNPKKLAELASIKDPVKFAVAVGKLETEVKVTKRQGTKPAPEKTVGGGSAAGSNSKATLERLQAEADRTGDRTKVAAYLRQQRLAGKK